MQRSDKVKIELKKMHNVIYNYEMSGSRKKVLSGKKFELTKTNKSNLLSIKELANANEKNICSKLFFLKILLFTFTQKIFHSNFFLIPDDTNWTVGWGTTGCCGGSPALLSCHPAVGGVLCLSLGQYLEILVTKNRTFINFVEGGGGQLQI